MKPLKIASSMTAMEYFLSQREAVLIEETDFTDVAAVVLTDLDSKWIKKVCDTKFDIPIFYIRRYPKDPVPESMRETCHVLDGSQEKLKTNSFDIEKAASEYQERVLPPFFDSLLCYMEMHHLKFNCPGHQGGQYFKKHPSGRYLYEFYGENIFLSDVCNADVALGDILIHEGPAAEAVMNAARVYNADKTYFVMNGTSTANTITVNAIVAPGDLVLFDRNNHKSVYTSALIQAGGNPVYLETSRNPFGFIGGIDEHCFNEQYLRQEAEKVDPLSLIHI